MGRNVKIILIIHRKKNKIDIEKSFIEVFEKYFNKEFDNELIKKNFKMYINLFQSFIDYENVISLKLYQFWNKNLKLKIDNFNEVNDFRVGNLKNLTSELLSKKLIKFDENDIDENEDENENYQKNKKKKKLYQNLSLDDIEIDDNFDDINLNELSTSVVYDPKVDFL